MHVHAWPSRQLMTIHMFVSCFEDIDKEDWVGLYGGEESRSRQHALHKTCLQSYLQQNFDG